MGGGGGWEGGREEGEGEDEKEKEAATCLSILQSKANSPETVRGTREHLYDNPRTPKIRTSKLERRPIE